MGELREIRIPDIGGFEDVDVVEVLVALGESVDVEQSLITLESDKASMEVPAPFPGTVQSLSVAVGDKVSEGTVIATVEVSAAAGSGDNGAPEPEAAVPAAAEPAAPEPAEEPPAAPAPEFRPAPVVPGAGDTDSRKVHAGPGVRRFARELGVDLSRVRGTGRKGRIVKEDVQAHVKSALQRPAAAAPGGGALALPAMPRVDWSRFGPVERQPLTRINKATGKNLHRSWLHVPHVTQFDEADITELEAFRQANKQSADRQGFKLTFLAFLLKATASALEAFPRFKSSLDPDGEHLILKQYCHVGVAVDTDQGLVVPVIRDVDQRGVFELAKELGDVSGRARDGKLKPAEMSGAVFTISSLGGIGGTAFTPVVNAPEVAILAVARARMQPVYQGDAFVPRLILPFGLSYDHRVIDGALGVRFTTHLATLLSDLRRILL